MVLSGEGIEGGYILSKMDTELDRLQQGDNNRRDAEEMNEKTVSVLSRMKQEREQLLTTLSAAEKMKQALANVVATSAEFSQQFETLNSVVTSSALHLNSHRNRLGELIDILQTYNTSIHTFATCIGEQFIKPLKVETEGWQMLSAGLEQQVKKHAKENVKKASALSKRVLMCQKNRDKLFSNPRNASTSKASIASSKYNEVLITYDQFFEAYSGMEKTFLENSIKEEVNRYTNVVERSTMLGKGLLGLMKTKDKLETWIAKDAKARDVEENDDGYLLAGEVDDDALDDNESEGAYDKPSSLINGRKNRKHRKSVTINDTRTSEEVEGWFGAVKKIDGSYDWSRRQTSQRGASLRAKSVPAERTSPSQPHVTGNAVAKFPYSAALPDELSLVPGMSILLLQESDDGWISGLATDTGEQGWFHGSFIQRNSEAMYYKTIKSYTPPSGNDSGSSKALSFSEGERIRILDKTGLDWWLGMNEQSLPSEVGFVPVRFVEPENQKVSRRRTGSEAAIVKPTANRRRSQNHSMPKQDSGRMNAAHNSVSRVRRHSFTDDNVPAIRNLTTNGESTF